jgi:hypothetical protein
MQALAAAQPAVPAVQQPVGVHHVEISSLMYACLSASEPPLKLKNSSPLSLV